MNEVIIYSNVIFKNYLQNALGREDAEKIEIKTYTHCACFNFYICLIIKKVSDPVQFVIQSYPIHVSPLGSLAPGGGRYTGVLVKCLLAGDPVVSRWCLMLAPGRERPRDYTQTLRRLQCDYTFTFRVALENGPAKVLVRLLFCNCFQMYLFYY